MSKGGSHRLKHTFTAGELSERLGARLDFDRYKNGCKKLRNMTCQVQGPATRRPGLKFVYDLNNIYIDTDEARVRMIPFIFAEDQAYALIFFQAESGEIYMVVGTDDGLVLAEGTTDVYALDLPVGFNIEEFDYAQSLDEMYIAQPDMQPIIIIRNAYNDWSWADLTFDCFPDDWPHDPITSTVVTDADYTATSNWPETVTFHQQRLMYGGNNSKPQSIWTSAAGDYLNFGDFDDVTCGGVDDADGMSFRLDSGTMNRIKWLISAKVLAVGTVGNEWTVQGAGQAAMAPQSLLAQRQTNMGSEKVKPLMVGLSTLFVERHGRTINEFKYEYTTDSYETSDRSVLATHFTDYHSIKDWTFQQLPDQVIWMVREDGIMLGCTYQREHKVVGWHLHETEGEFQALTSIPGQNRTDEVWVVVKREIDGADHFYVERLEDEFTGTEASEGRFLDSHVVKTPSGTEVSGLSHLEGMAVDILADGTVHPERTVSGGVITLDDTYTEVVVGLQYTSEVRPYLSDMPMQDGSSHGRMQRITYVDIDFFKTLGGYIGKYDSEDGETEEELVFRRPVDEMGVQVPLFTGIYHYEFLEGFDRVAEYFIRQKQPLPMTVRGVVDVVEVFI